MKWYRFQESYPESIGADKKEHIEFEAFVADSSTYEITINNPDPAYAVEFIDIIKGRFVLHRFDEDKLKKYISYCLNGEILNQTEFPYPASSILSPDFDKEIAGLYDSFYEHIPINTGNAIDNLREFIKSRDIAGCRSCYSLEPCGAIDRENPMKQLG